MSDFEYRVIGAALLLCAAMLAGCALALAHIALAWLSR